MTGFAYLGSQMGHRDDGEREPTLALRASIGT